MTTTSTTDIAPTSTDTTPAGMLVGDDVGRFVFSGRAVFTLRSVKTGVRFTYRVVSQEGRPSFVSVLTGPEVWTYLGSVFGQREDRSFRRTSKSSVSNTAPSFVAFGWFIKHINDLPPSCEVYHEGRCGRCGRPLTDPESIMSGLGPVCRDR
jgi:hypothetical protein